jgi:TRAP-type C4-dicarboxylate transport system permease small subunit
MKQLKHISDIVNKIVSYIGMVLFIILIIACVGQVFFRFALNHSLSWTEELARYMFIWMHMIGASLLIETRGHATVTVILELLSGTAKKIFDIIIELVILVDGSIMVYSGLVLAYRSRFNLSTAMSIPMWMINSAVAIGGLLLVFQSTVQIAVLLTEKKTAGLKAGEPA